jgi:hypothetical protein
MTSARRDGICGGRTEAVERYGDEGVSAWAAPLTDPGARDVLLDRVSDTRVGMLVEARKGTCVLRVAAAITRWLIEQENSSLRFPPTSRRRTLPRWTPAEPHEMR